jgi:hypothetical protein
MFPNVFAVEREIGIEPALIVDSEKLNGLPDPTPNNARPLRLLVELLKLRIVPSSFPEALLLRKQATINKSV